MYDGAGRERVKVDPFHATGSAFVDYATAGVPPTRATVITYDDQVPNFAYALRSAAWCSSYQYVSGALPGVAQTCTSDSSGTAGFRLATEVRRTGTAAGTPFVDFGGRAVAIDTVPAELNRVGAPTATQLPRSLIDATGNEVGTQDADSRSTWILRDALGRETASWRDAGTSSHATPSPASTIRYNTAGQVESVWDANSPDMRKCSRYDDAGRLTTVEFHPAADTGCVGASTGDKITYTYEQGDLGRITRVEQFAGDGNGNSGPPSTVAENYYDTPYDAADAGYAFVAGKLSWTKNGDTQIMYGYDDAGRVARRDQTFTVLGARRFTVNSEYGADGRVLSSRVVNPYAAANGLTYEAWYDSAGRPVKLTGKLDAASETTTFYEAYASGSFGAYDAAGRIGTMKADDGRAVSARTYNAYSGALEAECKRLGTEIQCFSTSPDAAKDLYRTSGAQYAGSKLASYTDDATQTAYTNEYEPSGRLKNATAQPLGPMVSLTQDWIEAFTANGIGSLDSVTAERNTLAATTSRPRLREREAYLPVTTTDGKLLDRVDAVAKQTTDLSGNLVPLETADEVSYGYDVLGHLTSVTREAGDDEDLYYAPGGELSYRRVSDGEGDGFVFYLGEYVTLKMPATAGGTPDEAGAELDAHIVFAGTRIASVTASRTLYYYRTRLGSVVATSVGGGLPGATYRYTPYGDVDLSSETAETRSDLGYTNAVRLTGGLLYLQTRVYDTKARVFIQPDSVDRLRYAYVGGDPLNYSDPTGLAARPEVQQPSISRLALMSSWDLMSMAAVDHSKRIPQSPTSNEKQTKKEKKQDGEALQNDQGKVDALSPEPPPAAPPNGEPDLQPGDRSRTMRAGEALYGEDVRKLIARYGKQIDTAASDFGVDAGLIRGIIYEEQTHLVPGVESDVSEGLGMGRTVGLGQVTVGLHGFTREQLLDPATNIRAIATHLSVLQKRPLISPSAPISSLATSYNCGSCTSITAYGRRVNFYRSQYFLP